MRQVNGWGRRAALGAVVVLAMLLAGSAARVGAFAPTNLKSLGSNSHQSITEDTVTALDKEFFSVSKLTRTMKKAMDQIVEANAAIDGDQTHSALHFDGENFAGGQAQILSLLGRALSDVRAKNGEAARRDLGGALHTLQDFYAHSNWIETSGGVNPDLGVAGHTIGNVAARTDPTCNGSTLIGAGLTKLTSGYYGGEDATPPAGVAKCRHGGPFDGGPGSGGINKDFRLATFSPHSTFHDAAAAAARQATEKFIREIKDQITKPQLRLLLGAGPVLGMAIDTTGSMGGVIAGVQSQAVSIVDARLGTDEEPSSYVLSPFNDPTSEPVTVTDDAAVFKGAINSLSANGGGDCPELSMSGMLDALSNMDQGGDLFMFTDADSKDSGLAGNVSSLATTNEVTVYPVLFGNCSQGGDSATTAATRATAAASVSAAATDFIDPAYLRIAADTGGQVFSISAANAGQITKLADFVVRANAVDLLAVTGDLAAGPKTFTVPVDSTMTKVTFSAGGAAAMTVTRPDGTVVASTDPGVDIVSLGGRLPATIVNVKSPAVGAWKVDLSGPTVYSLTVSGESALDLSSFRFMHEVPGHSGPFLTPISGFPLAGAASPVDTVVSGPFNSATFDLRGIDGSPLQTLGLTAVANPAVGEFSGNVTPTGTPFRVYVTGKDAAGNPFQRALPATVRPQALVVTPPASSDLHPDQTSTFTFQVQNLGASDSFHVAATDDKGYLQSVSPTGFSLGTNETQAVTVTLRPPASATDGTSDTLSVDVVSNTDPAVHNFAVVTNSVVAAPPDTTAPTTTATATPAANAAGWSNSDVTVALHAVDNAGGSGVKSITYSATGAQPIAATTVSGDSVSVPITTEGTTTLTFSSVDQTGNGEALQTLTIKLDKTPPVLNCRAIPSSYKASGHKLVPVLVLVQFSDALSGKAGFQLVSVTANERITPDDIAGFTVGKPDIFGFVRAEQNNKRSNRVYTFTYEGTDVAGNTDRCSTTVTIKKKEDDDRD